MHFNVNTGSLTQANLFCLKAIFQNDMLTFGERIYFSNAEFQLNFVSPIYYLKSEVIMAVVMKNTIFQDVM
jgi:hypothetical protein